jgi:3-hydroxyanthranilate 3,4-dioxygenase
MKTLQPFNLARWIELHRHMLKPPVGNVRVFRDTEFIVMVVGGPNTRKDFHVDPAEELFYQLEGEIVVRTMQHGRIVDVRIGPGEMMLLPPGVPHSPQRAAGTIGIVIERERRSGELDCFQWYCEGCGALLYEESFALTDIEKQFPPLFERFYGSESRRSCQRCGTVMRRPG